MNTFFKFFILLLILITAISGCSIKKIIDITNNGKDMQAPKWDMSFSVPILEKKIDMNDYFTVPNIVTSTLTLPSFPGVWSLPANNSLQDLGQSAPVSTSTPVSIDFDGDSVNDFTLTKITSTTGYLEIKVGLKLDGTPTPLDIGDIAFTGITIEGVTSDFNTPTKNSDGTLTFRTKNFLAGTGTVIQPTTIPPNNEINLSFLANQIVFNTSGKTAGTTPVTIELTFGVTFFLGTDYKIEGNITGGDKTIFQIANQDVPLTNNQMIINTFGVKLKNDNKLPCSFVLKGKFFNSSYNIDLLDQSNSPNITIPLGINEVEIKTADSIFNKGSMKLSIDLIVPDNSHLEITNNIYIKTILELYGAGVLDLKYF